MPLRTNCNKFSRLERSMADYGYMHRSSIADGKSRLGSRFQTWEPTAEEGWSTPSIVTKTEVREHVCRPVIVDPDGTTRPAVVIMSQQRRTDGIIGKIETVAECVYPSAAGYINGYAGREESGYGWGKYAGQFSDQPSKINEFITTVQTAASGPDRTGLFQRRTPNDLHGYGGNGTNDTTNSGWSKPSTGAYDMGTTGWSKPNSGIHETSANGWGRPSGGTHDTDTNPWGRPRSGTNGIGTTGWSKPSNHTYEATTNGWGTPSGGTNGIGTTGWRKPSSPTYETTTNGWGAPTGGTNDIGTGGWSRPSSKTNDITTNGWSRPTGAATQQKFYDGYYPKNESSLDEYHTPTMTTTDAWGRPSRVGYVKPSSYESTITKPTSNIGAAVDYVRESVRPSSVTAMAPRHVRFSAPSPTYPMYETIKETSDSKEAGQRYGGSVVTTPTTKAPTAPVIDSREAARKYNGSFV